MNKSLILRRHTCIQVDKKEKEISEVRDDIEIGERSDVSTCQLHSIDNFPDVKKKPRRSTVTIAMSIAMIFYIFTTICNPNTSNNSEDDSMGIPTEKVLDNTHNTKRRNRNLFFEYKIDARVGTSIGKEGELTPWTCNGQKNDINQRKSLHPSMQPYFNFTTSIKTNSRIIVMGDSVGIQISTYLQDLLQGDGDTKILKMPLGMGKDPKPSIHVTSPLSNDGQYGAIAGWRLTGILQRDSFNWAPANYNRGWHKEDVINLRDRITNTTAKMPNETMHIRNITGLGVTKKEYFTIQHSISGDFDVMIFRTPSPSWIKLEDVTYDTLQETIELANQLFGVHTVVLISLDYNNNVLTGEMRELIKIKNELMLDFARKWTRSPPDEGVQTVLVLNYAELSGSMIQENARLLGFDINNSSYLDKKLVGINKMNKKIESHRLSIAHVCSESVPNDSKDCTRNAITEDGMHMCTNIVGPRLVAGLFCQLQCTSLDDKADKSWICVEECNKDFMNLNRIIP